MRPIVVVLIVVALGIAGLTAVLLNRFIAAQKAPAQITQVIAPPASIEVLVAANDIPAGSIVKPGDLRYQAWSDNALDRRFVQRGNGEDPKTGFVGGIARRPLTVGEPITAEAVFRQDQAGVLSGMLSPGMRAVSFAINPMTGVGGFVLPNDHVDILLNQDVNASSGHGAGQPSRSDLARIATEVVLSNIRVLAVDDKLSKPDTQANIVGKTVTVEVTPKDAEVLLTATKMGELILALRSPAPGLEASGPPGEGEAGYTSDVEVSRALQSVLGGGGPANPATPALGRTREVHINRGGAPSMQSFAN